MMKIERRNRYDVIYEMCVLNVLLTLLLATWLIPI